MENKVNQEVMEPQKKNNKKIILIVTIVISSIVLIGASVFVGYNLLYKDKEDSNDINEDNNQVEEKYTLDVYKSEYDDYCESKSDYCNTLAFTIEVESKDAKLLNYQSKSFIIFQDNGIKIYDIKNDSIKATEVPANRDYSYSLVASDTKVTGIIINSYKDPEYYNIEKNKKMYDCKYEKIDAINDNYLVGWKNSQRVLLSANEEKEVNDYIDDNEINKDITYFGYSNKKISYKDKNFYVLTSYGPDSDFPIVAYDNNKKIITYLNDVGYDVVDNYLYVSINDSIKKYDIEGKLLKTLDNIKEKNAKMIIRNYVVYTKEDNALSLINIDTEEEKEIIKLKDGDYIDDWTTGYYSRDRLDSINEKDKVAGIYVVIYYQNKDENGNYGMEYCYTEDNEIKEYPILKPMDGRAKPVLYLYPTKKTKVTVEFAHPEYLMTTYPKYQDKWEVTASPNGDLKDKDNKYYYALYWDEVRHSEVDFHEGFYVTSDNAIEFLEDKLSIIGLNDRERNEFIMYWLPILENNGKNLVYFELTKERELNNKIIINPKPDSLLRIAIHIKKVDKKVNIKEEKLETFNRYGFSAIEWGGMVY